MMTIMTGIAGPSGGLPARTSSSVSSDPQGYDAVREVERAASATRHRYSQQTMQAIERLAKMLASKTPFRRDVPRGHYLNIRI